MKNAKEPKKRGARREKPIYNSHIHTFTLRNTPNLFFKFLLADPKAGKITFAKGAKLLALLLSPILLPILSRLLLITISNITSPGQAPTPFFAPVTIDLPTSYLPPVNISLPNLLFSPYPLILPAVLVVQTILLLPLLFLVYLLLRLIVSLALASLLDLLRAGDNGDRDSLKRNSITINQTVQNQLMKSVKNLTKPIVRDNTFFRTLERLIPLSNDKIERYARFINTAALGQQPEVFEEIQNQYPIGTKFIVLPMNMEHMRLGRVRETIDIQHADLLAMAQTLNSERRRKRKDEVVFPFYTVHPEQKDLEEIVKRMRDGEIFGKDKFRGLKIYPNLGYKPNDDRLMEIYKICEGKGVPVLSHCTPSGVWRYGTSELQRREYGRPDNYTMILTANKDLRICLAHFGGAEEWEEHLKGRPSRGEEKEKPWVNSIYEMIASGDYPNLYTDISYTVFTPEVKGSHVDLIDYLKVMLASNEKVRKRVLFGSDFYMVEQEKMSEKEVSILLRSRLGDDLFFQIAYTNPRKFLGIG